MLDSCYMPAHEMMGMHLGLKLEANMALCSSMAVLAQALKRAPALKLEPWMASQRCLHIVSLNQNVGSHQVRPDFKLHTLNPKISDRSATLSARSVYVRLPCAHAHIRSWMPSVSPATEAARWIPTEDRRDEGPAPKLRFFGMFRENVGICSSSRLALTGKQQARDGVLPEAYS